VGFAPVGRWAEHGDLSWEFDPRRLWPLTKTVIAMAVPSLLPVTETDDAFVYRSQYNNTNQLLDKIAYRLAAFLNQPIIPHGHHQDCENGFDLLSTAANSINSLGKVIWSDMASISRSNYLTQRENGTLTVKMLSRRIVLPVDKDVREVVVERPWISTDGKSESLIFREGDRARTSGVFGRQSAAIPLSGQGRVELISQSVDAVDYREVESPRFQVWSRARRVLSETRDRMAPLGFGRRPKLVAGNGQ